MLAVVGLLAVSESAGAAPTIDGGGGALHLDADASLMTDQQLEPGDTLYWPITASLGGIESGRLELRIEHAGILATTPGGLDLGVLECASAWSSDAVPTCASGATTVLNEALASLPSGRMFALGTISTASSRHFLATVGLPDVVPNDLQGTQATIALGFTALGENASVTVPLDGLPNTGATLGGPLLVGAGLVLAGLVFARQRASVGDDDTTDDDAAVQS